MCLPYLKFSDQSPEKHLLFIWPKPYFLNARSEGFGETACMGRLIRAVAAHIYIISANIILCIRHFIINFVNIRNWMTIIFVCKGNT